MRPVIPQWIYEVGFSPIQREAYLYVCMRGVCFDDKRSMASQLGVCKTRLWKALKVLVDHGWLDQKKAGRSTCYLARTKGKPIKSVPMTNTSQKQRVREDVHVNDTTCTRSRTLTNNIIDIDINNNSNRDEILTEIILAGRSKRSDVPRTVAADIKAGKKYFSI